MHDQAFANRVALVTGAGLGIGRAIAIGLAGRGALVHLVARRSETLDEVRRCVESQGGTARLLPFDITSDEDVATIARTVRDEHGRLDILVHSAGAYARGHLEALPVDELDLLYRTNVRAPYRLTQVLLPLIVPVQGQIVFINSTAGAEAPAGLGAYAASKHALRALADALRAEVSPLGVRVASVYPGRTNTPMQERVHALEGKSYHGDRLMQPEHVAEVVISTLTLPRDAEVTNVTVRSARRT